MDTDESVSPERRAKARERLQQRSADRSRDEADAEQASLDRVGVAGRPWLGVLLLGAAAVLPWPMSRALDAFTDEPLSQRDIGLHDFVGRHPRLCASVLLLVALTGAATFFAFMASWI